MKFTIEAAPMGYTVTSNDSTRTFSKLWLALSWIENQLKAAP